MPFLHQGLTEEEADMARNEYIDALMNGEDNETQLAEHWSLISPTLASRMLPLLHL